MKRIYTEIALAMVAALWVAASADAAVQGTVTLMRDPSIGIPFTSPDAALPAPWVSYALGLRSTAGELIGGVDVTLIGQFHQRWTFDEDLGSFQPTPNSLNSSNGDSHLRAVPSALFGALPTDNNSGSGSPLADNPTSDYGVGSLLRGIWGIAQAQTTTSLAYIVIPKGSEPTLNFSIKLANPAGEIIGNLTEQDFVQVFASANVTGNGLLIDDGDNTPRPDDFTDFGRSKSAVSFSVRLRSAIAERPPYRWGQPHSPGPTHFWDRCLARSIRGVVPISRYGSTRPRRASSQARSRSLPTPI